MGYVVTGTWVAREGFEDQVAGALLAMTPMALSEPGCMFFQASRDRGDLRRFFVYEQYVDEDAADFHTGSAHFQTYMKEQALLELESADTAFYVTLDTDQGERADVPLESRLEGGA